jgi:hypothetical protein
VRDGAGAPASHHHEFNAEAEGINPDNIAQRLIDMIPHDLNEKT